MHPCQESSLQPRIPVRDHPSSQHLPTSPTCRCCAPMAPCSPALLSRPGAAAAALSSSSPARTFTAAASRAGRAGCRAGPACGGSAAAGAGSSSRGSAAECGAAGKCAEVEPARDPASVGDTNVSSQTCPITQLPLSCCRADAETHGQECVHRVPHCGVGAVLLGMLLLSAQPTMPAEHRGETGPTSPNRLMGSPAGMETPKSYLYARYNLQDVQLSSSMGKTFRQPRKRS